MWCTEVRRILFSPHKFGGKTMQWREKYMNIVHNTANHKKIPVLQQNQSWNDNM
jgi:hypothetical protein